MIIRHCGQLASINKTVEVSSRRFSRILAFVEYQTGVSKYSSSFLAVFWRWIFDWELRQCGKVFKIHISNEESWNEHEFSHVLPLQYSKVAFFVFAATVYRANYSLPSESFTVSRSDLTVGYYIPVLEFTLQLSDYNVI